MKKTKHRILYIEKPAFVGGSITGLYETIHGLDRDRFEPVVLFHGPNPYREKFHALGVEVIVLNNDLPSGIQQVSTRDIAASLSRFGDWLGDAYRIAKQAQVMWRKDRPLAVRVAEIIREAKIDLIHHNNSLPGDRETIWAGKMAGIPQISYIRVLHDFGFWERRLARSVNLFIYMSQAIEKHYLARGISASQGRVIYDSFDLQTDIHSNHRQALRSEFGVAEQGWVISNIGRLDWWKGHEYFVEAIGQAIKSTPNIKALIVGEPDATALSQSYYQKIQEQVQRLGLVDHVIFTGFRTDIPEIMAASDIIVHSASEPEPFGRVAVEAMTAGRPIVATAAGGILEIVKDQETGLLVPPKDATAMAEAIHYLSENRERAVEMGRAGRLDAERRFSLDKHIASIQEVYEQLLGT